MEIKDIITGEGKSLYNYNKSIFDTQVVLITGAAGSIGQSLCLFLLNNFSPKQLILIDNSEYELFNIQQTLFLKGYKNFEVELVDICCQKTLSNVFAKYKPYTVYHAAAYKHVPLLEHFPYQAFKTNVLGTINVFECSLRYKVSDFIFISTDKAVNPTSVMGLTKRISEIYLSKYVHLSQSVNVKVVRLGNIPNSRGSVLPLWNKQLELTSKINIVDKSVSRYFISLDQVCFMLTELITEKSYSLFIADMGESVNIYNMGLAFVKNKGKNEEAIKNIKTRTGDKKHEDLFYKDEILTNEDSEITYFKGNLNVDNKNIVLLDEFLNRFEDTDVENLKEEYLKIVKKF